MVKAALWDDPVSHARMVKAALWEDPVSHARMVKAALWEDPVSDWIDAFQIAWMQDSMCNRR